MKLSLIPKNKVMNLKPLLFTLTALVSLLFFSCEKGGSTEEDESKPSLYFSSEKLIATQESTSKSARIVTSFESEEITITTSESWLTATLSIDESSSVLLVEISENDNLETRSATVTLEAGELSTTLTVEQTGIAPSIILDSKDVELDFTAQSFTVELVANIGEIEAVVADSWLTAIEVKAVEEAAHTFVFTATENTSSSKRSTTITFKGKDVDFEKELAVTQKIEPLPTGDLTMAYNLNLVYFIPSDIEAAVNYETRISELMFWARDFYATNMERWGYGYRGFGLRTTDEGLAKIITINGNYTSDSYSYDSGYPAVLSEIEAYFSENPSEKSSEHTLIIIPSYTGSTDPGGPPFYGVGKNCFALDYDDMDIQHLGETTTKGNLLTKWFGGMCHELGHGLNLPHNCQTVSQYTDPELGTTLMGAGNYTLGQQPTFLSEASCAILNNCQVFSETEQSFYEGSTTADINTYSIEFTTGTITVNGKLENYSSTFNAVNVYVDDYPYTGVNENYDAESWSTSDIVDGEFTIEIPTNEITETDDEFRVRAWFLFEGGGYIEENHDFTRGSEVDYLFKLESELDKAGWSITASNESHDTTAAEMIDGDISTIWHSAWWPSEIAHPHVITITLDEVKTLRGISITGRQDNSNGLINELELEISANGTDWVSEGTHTLEATSSKQYIYLSTPSQVKAFRISTASGHNSDNIASIAEIGAFE